MDIDPRLTGSAPAPGRRRGWMPLVAVVAALLGLAAVAGGISTGRDLAARGVLGSHATVQSPIRSVPQITAPAGQQIDAQAVAAKVVPAVVDINTVVGSGSRTGQAAGTGMILTSSGEILTNNHVVQGATGIKVTIQGRSGSYDARVVGVSPSADVALLKVDGVSGLPTVTLADTSNLTVGQDVVAVGNALGQGGTPTVTQGTITALDRSITAGQGGGRAERLTGLIQSDAPISPGDSGGPLANAAGQVLGMITAGETNGFRQTTSTVGFAIPADKALDVVNQIRSGKASSTVIIGQPGYLGVGVQDLDPSTAARLGLNGTSGALVTVVAPNSPAAQAGITPNSVITEINGTAIGSSEDVGPAIQTHKPGERVQVKWTDQSGTHTATATLIAGPAA